MRAVHSIVHIALVSLLLPAISPVHVSTGVYGLDAGYGGLFYSQDFREIYNSVCLDDGVYSEPVRFEITLHADQAHWTAGVNSYETTRPGWHHPFFE
jgi:hypothetical protein